ncbi:hypothetical protein PM082_001161 [Marasmius tenuissimus]|nr:hypothetical protein PM082_001161 [Marasmius tenuissimus]
MRIIPLDPLDGKSTRLIRPAECQFLRRLLMELIDNRLWISRGSQIDARIVGILTEEEFESWTYHLAGLSGVKTQVMYKLSKLSQKIQGFLRGTGEMLSPGGL